MSGSQTIVAVTDYCIWQPKNGRVGALRRQLAAVGKDPGAFRFWPAEYPNRPPGIGKRA